MKVMHLVASMSVVVFAACGGGSDGGTTTPTPNPTQKLATIRIPTNTVSLAAGSSASLAPQALDASGNVINGAAGYTYTSSNTAVAEAQASGAVLGIGAGTATITASLTRDGVTATSTATITVTGTLPVAATVAAGASDQTFAPATIVVKRNADVTFTFGALQHNVTFRTATGAPTSIPNSTSTSITRTFATAGDFNYDCTLHAGMTGMVMVR